MGCKPLVVEDFEFWAADIDCARKVQIELWLVYCAERDGIRNSEYTKRKAAAIKRTLEQRLEKRGLPIEAVQVLLGYIEANYTDCSIGRDMLRRL